MFAVIFLARNCTKIVSISITVILVPPQILCPRWVPHLFHPSPIPHPPIHSSFPPSFPERILPHVLWIPLFSYLLRGLEFCIVHSSLYFPFCPCKWPFPFVFKQAPLSFSAQKDENTSLNLRTPTAAAHSLSLSLLSPLELNLLKELSLLPHHPLTI